MDVICTVRECGSYHQRPGRQNISKDLYKQKAKEIPRGITFPFNKQDWTSASTKVAKHLLELFISISKPLKGTSLPERSVPKSLDDNCIVPNLQDAVWLVDILKKPTLYFSFYPTPSPSLLPSHRPPYSPPLVLYPRFSTRPSHHSNTPPSPSPTQRTD